MSRNVEQIIFDNSRFQVFLESVPAIEQAIPSGIFRLDGMSEDPHRTLVYLPANFSRVGGVVTHSAFFGNEIKPICYIEIYNYAQRMTSEYQEIIFIFFFTETSKNDVIVGEALVLTANKRMIGLPSLKRLRV